MVLVTVLLAGLIASVAFSFDFRQVRPIAEEILDGDLVTRPPADYFHFHAAFGCPTSPGSASAQLEAEMGTNSVQATQSMVESALNEVAGRWTDEDPPVLAFAGDGMPVVANVHGRLCCLSYRVVDPYPVTRPMVTRLARKRDGPHVVSLSEHPAGYEKRLFRGFS